MTLLVLCHVISKCQLAVPNRGYVQSLPSTLSRIMCPANLHAYDHHSLPRLACLSIRRTVVFNIPTILSAMPLEDG